MSIAGNAITYVPTRFAFGAFPKRSHVDWHVVGPPVQSMGHLCRPAANSKKAVSARGFWTTSLSSHCFG